MPFDSARSLLEDGARNAAQRRPHHVADPDEVRAATSARRCRAAAKVACAFALTVALLFGSTSARANSGIWISPSELGALPVSGAAWTALKTQADRSPCTPNLSYQSSSCNVVTLAKALVFARTRTETYRTQVLTALKTIIASGTYSGNALALGRELAAYVIAADLIDLKTFAPATDLQWRTKIKELRNARTNEGGTLVECHEYRPNNWGNHCGASRIAVDVYLGDLTDLGRAATVTQGYLGNRTLYAGFKYGDLSWQADSTRPVGINRKGATKDGHSVDGVLPDDQRRGGSFTWPPPKENYVYEGLQGVLAQALLLSRAGYDVWNWSDKALLRAFKWLHDQADYPAEGDDTWEPHVINYAYGTAFPAPLPARTGKNVGYTDWTLSKR